jgi:cyclase
MQNAIKFCVLQLLLKWILCCMLQFSNNAGRYFVIYFMLRCIKVKIDMGYRCKPAQSPDNCNFKPRTMILSRREFLRLGSFAALALASPFSLKATRAARLPEGFELLRDQIGIYSNRGGTIGWLMHADGCAVIDAQFPDTAAVCLSGLQKYRGQEYPSLNSENFMVDVLLNTHHHADHTGGNGVFRPKTGIIVAHENVPGLQRMQAQMRGSDAELVYADTTFPVRWQAGLGNEQITARYYGPAHTGGDSVVAFEQANVVHMGDLVFNGVFPFIDETGGASISNWIELLETVAAERNEDTIFIFGHGQPGMGVTGSVSDLLNMRDYLSALLEHVAVSHAAGMSREEAVGIASLDGFEHFISFGPRLSLAANLEVAWNELVGE